MAFILQEVWKNKFFLIEKSHIILIMIVTRNEKNNPLVK
jgi:hypothetical protein